MYCETPYCKDTIPLEMLRPYLYYIVNTMSTAPMMIDPLDRIIYIGNFFGLLNKYGIPPSLWSMTMLINGLNHPGEYAGASLLTTLHPTAMDGILNNFVSVIPR